jgi:putative inorganic carbon (hco3(-)) transporter
MDKRLPRSIRGIGISHAKEPEMRGRLIRDSSAIRQTSSVESGAESMKPTFGVVCLVSFCFVMFSQKLPIGSIAAIGAIVASVLRGGKFEIPIFYRWYLAYFIIGVVGLFATRYSDVVTEQILDAAKFVVLGLAACNILINQRSCRTFVLGYLALFALYPVRGALYNYILGITEGGRISWNFFFRNPNDLAMTCFLPLGMCAYLICIEKRKWIRICAYAGLVVLPGIQMLTQSRGAMLALAAGLLYVVLNLKERFRALLGIGILVSIAAAATPSGVWDRLARLSNLSSGDMAMVDAEGSAAGRATLMKTALGIARNNPILGIGFGAYEYENARVTQYDASVGHDERGLRDAHNAYLRAAAETGWIGALCVLMYVVSPITYCRSKRKEVLALGAHLQKNATAIMMLEASMIAYALGTLVNSAERNTYFVWQFVIPWALTAVLVRSISQPSPIPNGKRGSSPR